MNSKSIQNKKLSPRENIAKKSYSTNSSLVKKTILAVDITSDKKTNILEFILKSIEKDTDNYYITTPNPEMVVYANSHTSFKDILNASKVTLCDGVGLVWAGNMLGKPLTERFAGVEAVDSICKMVANCPITVGFFGGMPGVAERAADCLLKKYPGLDVAYAGSEWDQSRIGQFDNKSAMEDKSQNTNYQTQDTTSIGRKQKIDLLFVALGFPKQEEWMASHINKVPVRVMIGVGGAFDYIAGIVKRPPKWVQNIGMEWLYRLVRQPWRIRRQLALPIFVWMVLKEKFIIHKS